MPFSFVDDCAEHYTASIDGTKVNTGPLSQMVQFCSKWADNISRFGYDDPKKSSIAIDHEAPPACPAPALIPDLTDILGTA